MTLTRKEKVDCMHVAYKRMLFLFLIVVPNFATALDYYWVGGSGNWSELRHWATTSGGTIIHDQIPTAADHAIFDENSFTDPANQVRLDLDNIFANNLDFRKLNRDVLLMGPPQTVLNVFGSLYLTASVTLNFDGSFDFRGDDSGKELLFTGQTPFQLRFLAEGEWKFINDLIIDSLIHLEFGTVLFDTVSIQCERFEVFSTTGVDIDFGASEILITGDRVLLMPSYQWRESLHFDGPVQSIPGTSKITLPSTKASIGFYDMDKIRLGQVTLGQLGGSQLVTASWAGIFEFEKLHLRGDTHLEGGFVIKDLELDGGNIYSLQSNFNQEVGNLRTNTDCAMICHLRSSEGGIPARISATGGAQTISDVLLQDIQISAATYTANEAVDLGGNSGWEINKRQERTFFWVAGTGNWNDTTHWSFTSGGQPSGCLPTAVDDVIFDAASFSGPNQRVIINVPSAFCHTMDWRLINQPVILEHLNARRMLSLHIFGSLHFSPMVTNFFDGDVFFESFHDGNKIESAQKEFVKNVYFSSATGEWTLVDKLDVNDTLYFNSGALLTNNQGVETFEFYSQTNSKRRLDLGNSIFRIVQSTTNMYNPSNFIINATNFTIDPGQSTVLAENTTYANFYNNGVIDLYRVIFEGFGSVNVAEPKVTFSYGYFHHDGDFRGILNVDTLTFSPAKAYWIYMDSQINVDSMSAHGSCDGAIFIAGYPKGIQGKIQKTSGTLMVTATILEGIIGAGAATFIAQGSQDLGRNVGWTFMDAAPRSLYWVGGDGLWFDRQHWSLSSGGPGGECVPTAIDDVFFDENSFSGMYQNVGLTASNGPICHTLTWENAPNFTGLNDGVINITGSLYLQPNLSYFPWNTTFRSDSIGNEIHSGGNQLEWVDVMGNGTWQFMSDIHIPYQMNLWSGTVSTNDFDFRTGHLYMSDYPVDFKRKLILGNSHLIFEPMPIWDEQIFISSNNFEIEPGNSLAEFIGEYSTIRHYGRARLNLHNVLFSNVQGESRIEEYDQANFIFNKLDFYNNGVILNSNQMDTLLLAAGKLYRLEFNKTQRVYKHLRAIGNNCTPIGLESTEPGRRSTISSEGATVIGDFIQMRDQLATGGARFSAGAHSTDIGNNSGWIFEEDPDFIEIGFLGPDRALCRDSIINLSAYNFSPQEKYLWNNRFSGPEVGVNVPGTYWAQVTFKDNCVIRDSISIRDPLSLQVDLGTDSILCEGQKLTLNGDVDFYGAEYRWQDSTTNTDFTIGEAGEYYLNVKADGCDFSDTIQVDYNPLPTATIQGLKDVCEGDTLVLNAFQPNALYQWNDASTNQEISVARDGIYSVELNLKNCFASDTVEVDFFPVPSIALGPDTTLCEDELLAISLEQDNLEFLWSSGDRSDNLTIAAPGIYWLEASLAHCNTSDSIQVTYKPKPNLPALPDTALCQGTSWQIDLNESGASYRWNTGLQGGTLSINTSGQYQVLAGLNGCQRSDSFDVDFEPPPSLDLGPDQVKCDGEQVVLNLNEPGVRYIWEGTDLNTPFNIKHSGVYPLTAAKLNCEANDTLAVVFHPIPRLSLGPDQYVCPGESFTIETNEVYDQLTWNDQSVGPVFDNDVAGIYWLEAEENNCFFRDSIEIRNYSLPDIDLGTDTILCHDKTLKINALHPQVQRYVWQNGSEDPEIVASAPGIYSVHVDDGRCEADFDIEVQFRQCEYFSIYIPNAFTPNGDGLNEDFKPLMNPAAEILNYDFEIFSRWGEKIFSTDDPNTGWDGTFRGDRYTGDVFVSKVVVDYLDDSGPGKFEDAGSVMLLR